MRIVFECSIKAFITELRIRAYLRHGEDAGDTCAPLHVLVGDCRWHVAVPEVGKVLQTGVEEERHKRPLVAFDEISDPTRQIKKHFPIELSSIKRYSLSDVRVNAIDPQEFVYLMTRSGRSAANASCTSPSGPELCRIVYQ